jgi:hypothetical protein
MPDRGSLSRRDKRHTFMWLWEQTLLATLKVAVKGISTSGGPWQRIKWSRYVLFMLHDM